MNRPRISPNTGRDKGDEARTPIVGEMKSEGEAARGGDRKDVIIFQLTEA
jgi:hypothetical protein